MISKVRNNTRTIYIYNEKNTQTGVIYKGTKKNDGLIGYTANEITVRKGELIYSYDEKGRIINTIPNK